MSHCFIFILLIAFLGISSFGLTPPRSQVSCAPIIFEAAVAEAAKKIVLQFSILDRRDALEKMLESDSPIPVHVIPGMKPGVAPRPKKGAKPKKFDPFDTAENWARLNGIRRYCEDVALALREHANVSDLKLAVLLNDANYELYDLVFVKGTPEAVPKALVSPYALDNVVQAILLLVRLDHPLVPDLRQGMVRQIRDETTPFVRDQSARLLAVIDFLFAEAPETHPQLTELAKAKLSDRVRALHFVINEIELNHRIAQEREPKKISSPD